MIMRILQVIPSLNLVTGGPPISSTAVSRALASAGHEVTIFTTMWPAANGAKPATSSRESPEGVKVMIFPSASLSGCIGLPCSPTLVRSVRKRCHEFDAVLCHSLWNPIVTLAMHRLRQARIPYFLMPHGMLDPLVLGRHRRMKALCALAWERENVESASAVIFSSELEKKKALDSGWRLPRTSVFRHLVDLAYWEDLPSRSTFESRFPKVRGKEVILFVGRVDWVKNLDVLLDALALVRRSRPKAMLVCVGPHENPYREQLELRAHSLGVHEHLLFTGMQLGDDLKAAYACADAFALVSKKENFGLAAAEALACGLPVVLSEGVGLSGDCPNVGPVLRTRTEPSAIAGALIEVLKRSARLGLPDPEALSFARSRFGVQDPSGLPFLS